FEEPDAGQLAGRAGSCWGEQGSEASSLQPATFRL
ncbi:hypothetical protein A2U01_0070498, partial [Trifolium medium]|nr:hypothetical protein [Trifolium medium]